MSAVKEIIQRFFPQQKDKYAVWRLAHILCYGFLAAAAGIVFFFIYQNIYATLSNAYTIGVLASQAEIDAVDIEAYDSMRQILRDKTRPIAIPTGLRDVFIYYATSTPAETSKGKK